MARPYEDPPGAGGVAFGVPSLTRVVKALLIANVAVFLIQWVLFDGWMPRAFTWTEEAFALCPVQWHRFPLVPFWQLLTYGFLHASPEHVIMNMLGLYFFGTMLESEIGDRRFLIFYLGSVVVAGACQLGLGLSLGQVGPVVGASGGVLAIVCAMATLRPMTRVIFFVFPMTLRTMALIFLAVDLFRVVGQLKGGHNDVASFAHLSGALFGYLAVRQSWIWRDPVAQVESWRERRQEAQEASDEERLDALLQKISREGIHALSSSERAFLKRVSQRK